MSLDLDVDEDSRQPTDEEEDDDVIWLGSGVVSAQARPARPRQSAAELSTVGLTEVSGGVSPGGKAIKKLSHNRFGRSLGNLVTILLFSTQLSAQEVSISIDTGLTITYSFQETPQLPSYLSPTGAGRTMYSMAGWSLKRIKGVFTKGHKDGLFNGWPGRWSLPAVPTDTCYHEEREAQMLAVHVYTVGFYMGAAEGATEADVGPGGEVPSPVDAAHHRRIAEASVLLVGFSGETTSSGLIYSRAP